MKYSVYQDGTSVKILRAEDDSDVWNVMNPYTLETATLIVQALNGFPEVEMKKFREELAGHETVDADVKTEVEDMFPEDLF